MGSHELLWVEVPVFGVWSEHRWPQHRCWLALWVSAPQVQCGSCWTHHPPHTWHNMWEIGHRPWWKYLTARVLPGMIAALLFFQCLKSLHVCHLIFIILEWRAWPWLTWSHLVPQFVGIPTLTSSPVGSLQWGFTRLLSLFKVSSLCTFWTFDSRWHITLSYLPV